MIWSARVEARRLTVVSIGIVINFLGIILNFWQESQYMQVEIYEFDLCFYLSWFLLPVIFQVHLGLEYRSFHVCHFSYGPSIQVSLQQVIHWSHIEKRLCDQLHWRWSQSILVQILVACSTLSLISWGCKLLCLVYKPCFLCQGWWSLQVASYVHLCQLFHWGRLLWHWFGTARGCFHMHIWGWIKLM